eukprot:2925080-Amphidinium_carterae.1
MARQKQLRIPRTCRFSHTRQRSSSIFKSIESRTYRARQDPNKREVFRPCTRAGRGTKMAKAE